MDKENKYEHPWQLGPTELIKYALEHLDDKINNVDFNNRVAFLLLDIGVETLFKVYLGLPEGESKSSIPYHERCKAIKGGFHELVRCTDRCIRGKNDNINLSHVQYYHSIRNKLYHESDSITIPRNTVIGYANIAVQLLMLLLKVDLSVELQKYLESNEAEDNNYYKSIEVLSHKLKEELENCIEILAPFMLLPSFYKRLSKIDEKEPAYALWQLSEVVEEVFSIKIEQCFSKNDMDIVNRILMETTGADLSKHQSLKDTFLRVMSGVSDFGGMEIANLPFEGYQINSLHAGDFFWTSEIFEKEGLYLLYIKIIAEAIETDIRKGNFDRSYNIDKKIMNDSIRMIFNQKILGLSGASKPNRLEDSKSAEYLYEVIKDWRENYLEKQ